MTTESSTYLRLFDSNGDWIQRPDYMVLAALSDPDPKIMEHIYATMLLEDRQNPNANESGLSRFGADTKKRYIDKNVNHRVLAGGVILELCRLATATAKPPSVNMARRLVTYRETQNGNTASETSILREVQRDFSKYRDTAHFQAAAAIEPSLIYELEGDEDATLKFLGLARAFESFVDANVVSRSFQWSPVRIPSEIKPVNIISISSLTKQELKILDLI